MSLEKGILSGKGNHSSASLRINCPVGGNFALWGKKEWGVVLAIWGLGRDRQDKTECAKNSL